MMTPREALGVVAETLDSYCLKSPYAKADLLLTVLSAAGFEIVPTALVDAVLDPRTPCGGSEYLAARRALRAYRAPVLLGQTEETQP